MNFNKIKIDSLEQILTLEEIDDLENDVDDFNVSLEPKDFDFISNDMFNPSSGGSSLNKNQHIKKNEFVSVVLYESYEELSEILKSKKRICLIFDLELYRVQVLVSERTDAGSLINNFRKKVSSLQAIKNKGISHLVYGYVISIGLIDFPAIAASEEF